MMVIAKTFTRKASQMFIKHVKPFYFIASLSLRKQLINVSAVIAKKKNLDLGQYFIKVFQNLPNQRINSL